jgi:DNA-binding transcriptional ArsR family regulator
LARRAWIAPPTASAHLARLVDGGLLTRTRAGRHLYFSLANADVAEALELALSSPPGTIVVAGSLYLVGEARRRWLHDPRTRDPEVPGT